MAHLEKCKANQVNGLCLHDSRACKGHSNEEIDVERSHLNYNLAESIQPLNHNDFIKQRLSEVKCIKRADVNIMASWCVTLPKDYQGDERAFFESAFSFMADKYGAKNVISAYVHNDEKTPHLHFKFMPIVEDKGVEKVCFDKCVTRKDYKSFHKELKAHLESDLGIPCNILNGATENGNKTVQELKNKELTEQNQELERVNASYTAEIAQKESKLHKIDADLLKSSKKGLFGASAVESAKRVLEREEQLISREKELAEKIRNSEEYYHNLSLQLGTAQKRISDERNRLSDVVEEELQRRYSKVMQAKEKEITQLKEKLDVAEHIMSDSIYHDRIALDVFRNQFDRGIKRQRERE